VSKKWKIAIGVVIAAVVVAGVALAVWGATTFRHRVYEYGWRPGEWRTDAATQLEVRLVDDDGDGIPDRGVIEVPAGLPFGRGFGPGRGPSILRRGSGQAMHRTGLPFGPGHGLYPGQSFGPHFGRGFGPFLIVGGLFRLAFLALLIGLGVVCFRRWSRAKETREPQGG
jgi:hypothetical protein